MEGLALFVAVYKAGEPCFTLEITRVPFTLGASSRCDVVLDDPFVSRKHAVVTLTRGRLHFADTSSNGSFYRGQRIVNQLLDSGDTVEIHPFEVRFEYNLEDDEERHTALRGLDELISPEIRERLRGTPPPPGPPPRHATPDRGESGEPPGPPRAAHSPATPPPPSDATSRPARSVGPPPGDELAPEMGHETLTAPTLEEGEAAPSTAAAPVEEPAPPAVTVVPAASVRSHGPSASADVEDGGSPVVDGEGSADSTEIVPPPIPVPPRRPPVSRANDRPPFPREPAPRPADQPEEEPPTIAFATIRPTGGASEAAEQEEQEGTVHMPVEHLASLPPFSLEVIDGPSDQVGRTYPLPAREITVGRGDQADFRLVCDNISRLHASLSPHGPGQWLVRDLASLNGTYVGDQRITQVSLGLGGELRLANAITLRLVETGGAGPQGP